MSFIIRWINGGIVNYSDFISSIEFMLLGVSAVFILIAIISIIVYVFTKINKGGAW